jgi:hypothetical protein
MYTNLVESLLNTKLPLNIVTVMFNTFMPPMNPGLKTIFEKLLGALPGTVSELI